MVRIVAIYIGAILLCGALIGSGPDSTSRSENRSIKDEQNPSRIYNPDRFRCIVVGDSQMSGPNPNGIRTQMHGWDANITGDLLTVGNSSSGYQVTTSSGGDPNLVYRGVDMFAGWGDAGPDDFFAANGHEWICGGDIVANGSRIARLRLNFSASNIDSPWNEDWGVGHDLIARIAIRTSPYTVPAIQVRPERGAQVASQLGTTHLLNPQWGIQIIEQPIPAWIDPQAGEVGVGLYFPSGVIEQQSQKLGVIGVSFHRVDKNGNVEDGSFIGYQGRSSFRVWNHVNQISQQSRIAMIKMIDPQCIVIMLGHNTEWDGFSVYEPGLLALMDLWEDAFAVTGRPRPGFIFMSPWGIGPQTDQPYLKAVDRANRRVSELHRGDSFVSLFNRYGMVSPELFDPKNYDMDSALVHPNDAATARRIALDIYHLVFRK